MAPRDGRIQYRIANIGEVLPAGGKVFTMLDISYVYMDVYLPTPEAGKIKVGTDARIVLDAYPNRPIPAKVSFIASQAQFTPKDGGNPERARQADVPHPGADRCLIVRAVTPKSVRSGLPGVAYIRTDPAVVWPKNLQGEP